MRLIDHDLQTAWGSGPGQDGQEELVVDLGAPRSVGFVVLSMGSYSFGYPRNLSVETSLDGIGWSSVWTGRTSVLTVRAALADPGIVPLALAFDARSARLVRLQQTAQDPRNPWWVAELAVHSP